MSQDLHFVSIVRRSRWYVFLLVLLLALVVGFVWGQGQLSAAQAQAVAVQSSTASDAVDTFTVPLPWAQGVGREIRVDVEQATPSPLCRFGVNITSGAATYPVADLRMGWYQDYAARLEPVRPNGAIYAQTLRLAQTGDDSYSVRPSISVIEEIAAQNPGAIWFVGNEPDRIIYQDDIEPQVYALAYHELYGVIKAVDPTARLFAGTIVQPTPLRLMYLDKVLTSYQEKYGTAMPVDGWSIHNFILNEAKCGVFPPSECWGADIPPGVDATEGLRVDVQDNDNFDLFVEQIERFRDWMWRHGYRDTPLYLSEYGVLMPQGAGFLPDFTAERVSQFMVKTFDYLLTTTDDEKGYPRDGNRLVQRLSWFSTDYTAYNGYLFDPGSKDFTEIGLAYKNYTNGLQETVDFYPVSVVTTPTVPIDSAEPFTITLTAQIANSGNGVAAQTAEVRFYDGAPDAGGTQIGETQTVQLAGCGASAEVSVVWPERSMGVNTVYVVVSGATGSLAEEEPALANNTLMRTLIFVTDPVFLPLLQR